MTGKKLFNGNDYKEILRENRDCDIDFSDPILKDVPPSGKNVVLWGDITEKIKKEKKIAYQLLYFFEFSVFFFIFSHIFSLYFLN